MTLNQHPFGEKGFTYFKDSDGELQMGVISQGKLHQTNSKALDLTCPATKTMYIAAGVALELATAHCMEGKNVSAQKDALVGTVMGKFWEYAAEYEKNRVEEKQNVIES
jgi:hypothetical protein